MDQMGIMRFKDPETQEVKEEYELTDDKNRANLARVETGATASKDYVAGDYVIVGGKLYKINSKITSGTAWADVMTDYYLTQVNLADAISASLSDKGVNYFVSSWNYIGTGPGGFSFIDHYLSKYSALFLIVQASDTDFGFAVIPTAVIKASVGATIHQIIKVYKSASYYIEVLVDITYEITKHGNTLSVKCNSGYLISHAGWTDKKKIISGFIY